MGKNFSEEIPLLDRRYSGINHGTSVRFFREKSEKHRGIARKPLIKALERSSRNELQMFRDWFLFIKKVSGPRYRLVYTRSLSRNGKSRGKIEDRVRTSFPRLSYEIKMSPMFADSLHTVLSYLPYTRTIEFCSLPSYTTEGRDSKGHGHLWFMVCTIPPIVSASSSIQRYLTMFA